jgi:hypothetical protein
LSNFIETFRDLYIDELLDASDDLFIQAEKVYNMLKTLEFREKISNELGINFEQIDKEISNVKKGLSYDEHEWNF